MHRDNNNNHDYWQEITAYDNRGIRMKINKLNDTYIQRLKELDEFNKAYDLGIDVYRVFIATTEHLKYNHNIPPEQSIDQCIMATADTIEGKLQYMYDIKEIKNMWKLEK